ncbi:hypothetical protein LCGC14_1507690 [marine sediment metagenome]|uniref:Uncharacterized protein n=1 Tax=marine sediment metagenome TaxID=412755 RepID=A0A0F9M3N0_9ZZZZ
MRSRSSIEADGSRYDIKSLEVLLDIRDLLKKRAPAPRRKVTRRRKPDAGS